MNQEFNVVVVGGGVAGSAIARELCRYQLIVGVLGKNLDVCYETSDRNSAVLHSGFAYESGFLKAKLCVEGNHEFNHVVKELDVPFLRTGKVLVGNTPERDGQPAQNPGSRKDQRCDRSGDHR
ncbi:FAD-dependent oxidoreductase [Marasmitruncus massiliensis]|uniref:FAD-dependent oxidoreductase n=1 Tax=Marasmitruncus massiliensis TaxID=1944642 RepID=UPI00241EE184|nr:FAD-dependent oxidoreductase [Marasmitruncus massiliensis]